MVSNNDGVSNYLTPTLGAKRAPSAALKSAIRDKSWTVRDAADYLEVSRQRLYSAIADKHRARFWDLAILNLPMCSEAIRNELALARAANKRKRHKRANAKALPKPQTHSIDVDDYVVAISYAGIAEEGDQGCVIAVRGHGAWREYQVETTSGQRWFSQDEFDDHFQTTGLSRGPGV